MTALITSAKTATGCFELYLDAAYIVKLYVREIGSESVRSLVHSAGRVVTSAWSLAEVNCTIHRHLREGHFSVDQCREQVAQFASHVAAGVWELVPVTDLLLRRTANLSFLPAGNFLRAGDAIHLLTAQGLGEGEIWTNDRHMLAAAPYFGLTGRSV